MNTLGSATVSAANATPASALVVAYNPARRALRITNLSDATVYLAEGSPAVVGSGHALAPATGSAPALVPGGVYETPREGNLFQGAVYAIHGSTGDKALAISQS